MLGIGIGCIRTFGREPPEETTGSRSFLGFLPVFVYHSGVYVNELLAFEPLRGASAAPRQIAIVIEKSNFSLSRGRALYCLQITTGEFYCSSSEDLFSAMPREYA